MPNIATQGNEIIVASGDEPVTPSNDRGSALVSWVVGRVGPWEDHRNRGYQRLWGEYWRLWRGKWSEEDRNRKSERSRLIAPALAQAIEATVSEIEESIFSREVWFDVVDDIADQDRLDAIVARDKLLEDFDKTNVQDALLEAILNAAIFGTGIVKISVDVIKYGVPVRNPDTQKLEQKQEERTYVCVDALRPDEFIPDPAGKTIPEMLGCAHRITRPVHAVLEKIEQGIYLKSALGTIKGGYATGENAIDSGDPQAFLRPAEADVVDVLEYHGKVPLALLERVSEDTSELDELLDIDSDGADSPLCEAIVTIANDGTLLRAMKSPFVMRDRSIVAFQFEKVPGRFWGRGVAEKGYNPQKALDSELRARQDALGFISAPMLALDAGRIPRGFRLEVKPGKLWLTNGNPNEVISPVKIGDLQAATFNQTQEMERMVQMGTGAFDTATPLRQQSQSGSNAASSNSGMMGAFVKRAKRAVRSVDRNLIQPVIKKALWRYMQFEPARYAKDYDFHVKASLGIVAREVEAMQLTQLLGMLPEQVPGVALAVTQGIIENSSVSNKAEIVKTIQKALEPPSEEEQQKQKEMQDLQFEAAKADATQKLLENQETLAKIRKLLAEAKVATRKADIAEVEVQQEQQRIELQEKELNQFEYQNHIALKRLQIQEKQVDAKIQESKNTPTRV